MKQEDSDLNRRMNDLLQIAERFNFHALEKRIRLIKRRSSDVDVAVFGRFKAGKSSFLNHFFRRDLLPVGVTPVTAVVTRIKYGPAEGATVHFKDGSATQIQLSELSTYIAEPLNPENIKKVEAVDVLLPSLKPFEGLRFVDTPGLGSVFQHNTDASLNWLPEVGVAIVAISADSPLSEGDRALIKEIERFTPRVVVLITKTDLLNDSQVDEVSNFIKAQLNSSGTEHVVFAYSIKPGFDSARDQLEKSVFYRLMRDRIATANDIHQYKIESIKKECVALLAIALKSAEQSDADRARLRQKIVSERLGWKFLDDELSILKREYSKRVRPFLTDELSKNQSRIYQELIVEFDSQFSGWSGRLWTLTRHFEDWLRVNITGELSALSNDLTGTFLKPLSDAQFAFVRTVQAFQARLSLNVKDVLGLDLPQSEFDMDIKFPSQPDTSFYRVFDSHLDLLSPFVPVFLFRASIRRHFRSQIFPEIEKNLSRLATQWSGSIVQSVDLMEADARGFCQSQLDQIDTTLSANPSNIAVIKSAIETLK